MNRHLSFFVCRLDKAPSYVAVLVKGQGKGNPGFVGIPLGCRQPRIRNTCYYISFYGVSLGQGTSRLESGFVNRDAVDYGIISCEINLIFCMILI